MPPVAHESVVPVLVEGSVTEGNGELSVPASTVAELMTEVPAGLRAESERPFGALTMHDALPYDPPNVPLVHKRACDTHWLPAGTDAA